MRSRYGRTIVYAASGLALYIFNTGDIIQHVCFLTLLINGLLYGLIAMQPGNPLDYRGFQRPEGENNFLDRIQSMGTTGFD